RRQVGESHALVVGGRVAGGDRASRRVIRRMAPPSEESVGPAGDAGIPGGPAGGLRGEAGATATRNRTPLLGCAGPPAFPVVRLCATDPHLTARPQLLN